MGYPGGSLHFTEDPGAALPREGVLGRHLPLKTPRILLLGWEELGEFLGWEGGSHPGCFMWCPLKRLHGPQVSTGGQSTPMRWVLVTMCEKALGAPETTVTWVMPFDDAGALRMAGPGPGGLGEEGLKSTHIHLSSLELCQASGKCVLKGYLLLVYQRRVHFLFVCFSNFSSRSAECWAWLLIHFWLFATQKAVACQALLSIPRRIHLFRIHQARILEWVAMPSRGSFQSRDRAQVSCIVADSLPSEPPGKPRNTGVGNLSLLQRIFLIHELNWGFLLCRWILYQPSYRGSLRWLFLPEWDLLRNR